jgi:hypothetical protein
MLSKITETGSRSSMTDEIYKKCLSTYHSEKIDLITIVTKKILKVLNEFAGC